MTLVELKDIRKSFSMGREEVEILHGISLSVEKGEFVAMMGPSGSGKSTTMNILGCLDKPTSGTYFLNGQNINDLESDELAVIRNRTIGFVFQGFNLLQKTSALENVELPLLYAGMQKKERRERAKEALIQMGLEDRLYHEPTQLSGGQQQRVAIARGIVNRAPILMADEPTGNLDSKTSDEIMGLFKKINEKEGTTILLVTHEPDVAAYAKRIVHFKDGMITSDEPNRMVKSA
ncbi:MAG TPA: ABC transporter ATP-binding protein [Synergistaceae bacterium]|jgi:putative ABC transport system ATP-binding protein|uniref:ABC transporter ATP-binding protein n=1 Tax=Synergistaceae TaxID=649777 RepID=UPI000EEF05FB|nr:ABC transporter ATP-binding protein [Synergistaceae bacterium]HAH70161.1 macrolide ABC transporter ATP-binding protein [Synergistaceae bacterium]HPX02986.1 ABC transporter ATP-binding protein [Synergistaceae bacterium]HQA54944.1 ABC transporter ATP-binding protein [Synergistaceae bacterium]